MPRRKRFRNRKGRKKRNQVKSKKEKLVHEPNDVARQSPETNSRDGLTKNITQIFTPPKRTCTPSPRNEPVDTPLNNELPIDLPSITETPINKRRSWNRERKSDYEWVNVTNLNVLFDSNFINNSPKSEHNVSVGKNSSFHRSKSSMSKLHSPEKGKPLFVNQSTQTLESDLYIKQLNLITETPKYSTVLLQENPKTYRFPLLMNNQDPFNIHETCFDKIGRYEKGVNINPYLKNQEVDGKNINNSFGELSFFSPHLFQHKISSTPIEKVLNKAIEIEESDANGDLNDSKLDLHDRFIDNSFGTPKLNANLHVNDGTSPDKLVNKEDSMKNLIISSTNLCRKTPNIKGSPKKKSIINSRIYSRTRHFSCSKLNVSRRSSYEGSKFSAVGACQRVLMRLKKYCTASQTWSAKVIEVCTQLGIQLKNSISSVCNIYKDSSIVAQNESGKCKCIEYKRDIEGLKVEIEMQKKKVEDVEHLKDELNKVKKDIAHLTNIGKEIQILKEQCKCLHLNTSMASMSQPSYLLPPPPCISLPAIHPLPPPPPPLPPPPPPPLPHSTPIMNSLKMTKKTIKSGASEKENSRPVISLDDILKVKLKKTTDRYQTPVTRYNSQPLVSIEMLKQVKLRPASRNSLIIDTPDINTESTTSPHSSLCRLLKNELSVPRLKRLRRVGAYSYDSLYRKKDLSRRDREDTG